MSSFLLYGATGFTGRLTAARAVELGMKPVLGGRTAAPLAALAKSLGLEHRVFALDDPAAIDAALAGIPLLLNCAGPFSKTARPCVTACLRARVPYIDITGEVDVLESIFALDAEARSAGITLLPACGFDVVPSDCLALHLKQRLPSATRLTLGFRAPTRLSPGTAATMLERMRDPGLVRRNGALTPVPVGSLRRSTPFPSIAIPWGDLATAFRSTQIPNIETFAAAGRAERFGLALSRIPLLSSLIRAFIRSSATGPDAAMRRSARAVVWGEVSDAAGKIVSARLETPEPYAFTVEASLAVVKRILAGSAPKGAHTPASAFGSEFVIEVGGVTRRDD